MDPGAVSTKGFVRQPDLVGVGEQDRASEQAGLFQKRQAGHLADTVEIIRGRKGRNLMDISAGENGGCSGAGDTGGIVDQGELADQHAIDVGYGVQRAWWQLPVSRCQGHANVIFELGCSYPPLGTTGGLPSPGRFLLCVRKV